MQERSPIRVLIAPNAFKHALSAEEAAVAIEAGLSKSRLHCVCKRFPVADGGDGTGRLILEALDGVLEQVEVNDPIGRRVMASYGLIDRGRTAVIEMAEASGLRLLAPEEYAPLRTTTYGTGELIKAALDRGVRRVILGMGGSATVDGGTGILQALGAQLLSAKGEVLQGGEDRLDLFKVETAGIDPRLRSTELIILCDVDNPLLGINGAATVFGPQKGASQEDVARLEMFLCRLTQSAFQETGKDVSAIQHGGTAGGAAAALWAYLGARLERGAHYFLQLTGFQAALQTADLVITGEGSVDRQTLLGKAPYEVARSAKGRSLPVIALAGQIPLDTDELAPFFDSVIPIGNAPSDLDTALRFTRQNLERTAKQVGELLALRK